MYKNHNISIKGHYQLIWIACLDVVYGYLIWSLPQLPQLSKLAHIRFTNRWKNLCKWTQAIKDIQVPFCIFTLRSLDPARGLVIYGNNQIHVLKNWYSGFSKDTYKLFV